MWGALTALMLMGCAAPEPAASTAATLRTSNALLENGLTTNALWQNGLWQNGIWENGRWSNGIWENGRWSNGIWENGRWSNGRWSNGIFENGRWSNGRWSNGIWENGRWSNGADAEMLASSVYARQFLQYTYSCAMPGTLDPSSGQQVYGTNLDPNNGTLECGVGDSCDLGYECVTGEAGTKTCVVPLRGAIGLGINADESTWWESGTCDESCQRWVSACLLARTNAYGVKVEISMRAPDTAPLKVRQALATTPDEVTELPLREGAFYGNMFASTPVDDPPEPGYTGAEPGAIEATPSLNACAGPASNIPDMTKRFCSSQGDQTVIDVPGVCTEVCDGRDAAGAIHGCRTERGVHYDEVITVYLREPLATCGNGVCEDQVRSIEGGNIIDGAENSLSCPSDCHPDGWARHYAPGFGFGVEFSGPADGMRGPDGEGPAAPEQAWLNRALSAVSPVDDSIVLVGTASFDVDLGCGAPLPNNGLDYGILVKLDASTGECLWNVRFPYSANGNIPLQLAVGLTVGPDGTIIVTGWHPFDNDGDLDTREEAVFIIRFAEDGTKLEPVWTPVVSSNLGPHLAGVESTRLVEVDSEGSIILAGRLYQQTNFGDDIAIAVSDDRPDPFLTKLTPAGDVAWAWSVSGGAGGLSRQPLSLATNSDGYSLLLTGELEFGAVRVPGGTLRKFSPDGLLLLPAPIHAPPNVVFTVAGLDPNGEVYAGGYLQSGANFGDGVITVNGLVPFLAKYSGDSGEFEWVEYANVVCPPFIETCGDALDAFAITQRREVQAVSIDFDAAGNVLLGSYGNAVRGGAIDFGAGAFQTYNDNNIFVSAYDPDADAGQRFLWAKQIPTILGSTLHDLTLNSRGHLVLSGNYGGSMQTDGRMLVSERPETPVVNTFVSSFDMPSLTDTEGARIGVRDDSPDAPALTVPADTYAQATGPDGAMVFFMPPTAIDDGHAGVNVVCSPAPNNVFPLGDTLVTCTAVDARGNVGPQSVAAFTVHVVDTLGPIFTGIPDDIRAPATATGGAVVTYLPPAATDQVDGSRAVTCAPPSGSTFYFGTTVVTCTSSDTRENMSSASFDVRVPYEWSGYLQPINANGSSVFKLGRTVPVKFQLTGFSACINDLVARLTLRKVASTVMGTSIEAVSTSAATTGNLFRYDASSRQYIFNLSTSNLSTGTWELSVDMGDGESRTIRISLR
jgi:hypothetical protein